MARRGAVEALGLLDERFYLYWEETDWCLRARHAGWQVLQAPQAKVWHQGVQRDYQPSPDVTYYSARNHWLFLALHQAPLGVRAQVLAEQLRTLASWTLRPRWRHMGAQRTALRQALWDAACQRWGPRRPELRS
jgi:GT2 family glycosyltransferase